MKKSGFIDSVRVNEPCSESWEEMVGNDQVRFCTHCAKSVNNISAMTRRKAEKLVRRSSGRLCIRYVQNAQTKGPLFSNELVQIARRTSRAAASVMSTALTMSTLTFAQGGVSPRLEQISSSSEKETAGRLKDAAVSGSNGSISGTVTDVMGALIPGTVVTLLDEKGKELRSARSNDEGFFKFDNVADGRYTVQLDAAGFRLTRHEDVVVNGEMILGNVTMEVGEIVNGGAIIADLEYKGELASLVVIDGLDAAADFIARGGNVNEREEDKTTPLFIAVENGNVEMARLLLNFGAKVNARNANKETPLMRIDEDASRELVDLLVQHGAKVNLKDEEGNTALMAAASESKPEVLQALIDAGAEIDAQNDEGVTALMNAAESGIKEKVEALILAGADVNLKDKEGDNAWIYADEKEIEALLVAHGVIVPPQKVEAEVPEPPPS